MTDTPSSNTQAGQSPAPAASETSTNGAATAPTSATALGLFKQFSDGDAAEAPKTAPTEEPKASAPPAPAKPKIKAYTAEGEIELPEDAKFKAKVGENEIEFTVKDSVNSYKTSKRIAQDFSELDKQRIAIRKDQEEIGKAKSELAYIDSNLRAIQAAARNGDLLGVSNLVLRMGGESNSTEMKALFKQAEELAQKIAAMSDEEKENFLAAENSKYETTELRNQNASLKAKLTNIDLENHVNKIRTENNISDKELDDALGSLVAKSKRENSKLPNDAFQVADLCKRWVLASRQLDKLKSGVRKVSPEKENDMDLLNFLANGVEPSWTEDDVADIVRGYLGIDKSAKSSQDSSKEVGSNEASASTSYVKTPPEEAAKTAPKAEKDEPKRPIVNFQDLIDKYND